MEKLGSLNMIFLDQNTFDIFDNIIMLKNLIKETNPNAKITLMVNNDRKELFEEQFSSLIVVDSNKNTNFFYNFRLFIRQI